MANTGAPHSLPYPTAADGPNGPAQIQALAAQTATRIGFTGSSIIATSETRTSSSYGLLTTPDRVQSVVMPTDGIIQVWFHALWSQSTAVAANAALFLGSNQLVASTHTGLTDRSVAVTGSGGTSHGIDHYLTSYWGGLISDTSGGSAIPTSPQTTGQVIGADAGTPYGGPVSIFAAAGTYTVSVQFKTTSGTLTIKSRKLWVRALPFS